MQPKNKKKEMVLKSKVSILKHHFLSWTEWLSTLFLPAISQDLCFWLVSAPQILPCLHLDPSLLWFLLCVHICVTCQEPQIDYISPRKVALLKSGQL